jgi:hypothetical protein
MMPSPVLPSAYATAWARSISNNLSGLNLIHGRAASSCHSTSLPFCLRFNDVVTDGAARLDTSCLAQAWLGGIRSRWMTRHFLFAPQGFAGPVAAPLRRELISGCPSRTQARSLAAERRFSVQHPARALPTSAAVAQAAPGHHRRRRGREHGGGAGEGAPCGLHARRVKGQHLHGGDDDVDAAARRGRVPGASAATARTTAAEVAATRADAAHFIVAEGVGLP